MKISILHRTSESRGDHNADVLLAIEPVPGETVEQLMERLKVGPTDVIELRPVQPSRED